MGRIREIELPWTQQPQGVVRLDTAHPLALGLRGAWFGGRHAINVVTGALSSAPGGVAVASEHGIVTRYAGTPTDTGALLGGLGSQFTVAIRLRPSQTVGHKVCGSHLDGGTGWLMAIESGSLNMYCDRSQKIGANVSVGAWSQIAFSFDAANTKRIAANGVVTASAQSATASPSATPLLIGSYQWPGYAEFDGDIDYLCIWDRGLSSDELVAVQANPWQLFAPITRRIWVPSAGGSAVPDIAGIVAENITATSASYRVTLNYA